MAELVTWHLPEHIVGNSAKSIRLEIAPLGPIGLRDYIIYVEGVESGDFVSANPGWHHSAKVQAPFKYVPPIDIATTSLELGLITFPESDRSKSVTIYTWRPGAVAATSVFDVALVTPVDETGLVYTNFLEGVAGER